MKKPFSVASWDLRGVSPFCAKEESRQCLAIKSMFPGPSLKPLAFHPALVSWHLWPLTHASVWIAVYPAYKLLCLLKPHRMSPGRSAFLRLWVTISLPQECHVPWAFTGHLNGKQTKAHNKEKSLPSTLVIRAESWRPWGESRVQCFFVEDSGLGLSGFEMPFLLNGT